MQTLFAAEGWACAPISRIEDLRDAVRGAGLEATQMSRGTLSGGMAFSERDGVLFSCGQIGGRVTLRGSLSVDRVTIGIGLVMPHGSRHWLNEVESGNVGVWLPGDEHDAIYPAGTLYASMTLAPERLEAEAASLGLVLDAKSLGGTGVHARKLSRGLLGLLQSEFRSVRGAHAASRDPARRMLDAVIRHLARPPRTLNSGRNPGGHGQIVKRARAYIVAHLSEPISVDEIALAAGASRRTLFRAFAEILDDTPRLYVRKMRLHRIRRELADERERACTISLIANEWGMSDPGRMAGWYRDLFGERPSETLSETRPRR